MGKPSLGRVYNQRSLVKITEHTHVMNMRRHIFKSRL